MHGQHGETQRRILSSSAYDKLHKQSPLQYNIKGEEKGRLDINV